MWYNQCRFHVHLHRYLSRATPAALITPKYHRPRSSLASMGAIGTGRVDTSERLARLRALMQRQDVNVGAFVVPSEDERECDPFFLVCLSFSFDPDFSEYPSEADKRRAFISGFNGSAGDHRCEIGMRICIHVLIRRMCRHHPQGRLPLHRWSLLPAGRTAIG